MQKFNAETEHLNKKQAKNNTFADEEFAQPLDEHSVEEKERAQKTGNDSVSETKDENK